MIPKIKINSDQNELAFIRNGSAKDTFIYQYVKSFTKNGIEVTWSKDEIEKMLKNNIIAKI